MHLTFVIALSWIHGICVTKSLTTPSPTGEDTSSLTAAPFYVNCTSSNFQCANGECIDGNLVCNGVDSCDDGSDEEHCQQEAINCWSWQEHCVNGSCNKESFQCNNGKCINLTMLCDRINNCGDESDELRAVTGFKCSLGKGGDICVLPQRYINDSIVHCNDGADESERLDKNQRSFQCFDNSLVISDSQQCDGVVDCEDLSDECPCEDRIEKLCVRYCTGDEEFGQTNCTYGTFVCLNRTEILPSQVCDGKIDCVDAVDEKFCRRNSTNEVIECAGDVDGETTKLARLCDGRPECFDFSDECTSMCGTNTSTFPRFCNLNITTAPFIYGCSTLSASKYLTASDFCNGMWSECDSDVAEEEMGCSGRYFCTSGSLISIDISLRCNGFRECDDGSDEMDCGSTRFDCKDDGGGLISVPWSFLVDGVKDCDNGNDECPTDLNNEPVASQKYLIASTFFQVWVWIVGFLCIFGNAYIIFTKVREFSQVRKSSGLAKSNHFFVFNLAIADSIMAVYLLGISIKHIEVSGIYCQEDISWRTGTACFMLGAATVLSSEASVLMLVLLTTLRLISVYYPLQTRHFKFKWAVLAICIAWSIALTLAFLPASELAKEAFTYGAFIPSKFISHVSATLEEVQYFATMMSVFSPNSTIIKAEANWAYLDDYLSQNHPDHSIKEFYGYYSKHSVCMPNFYVTSDNIMWGYSFAITFANFLIFVYILTAYIVIYRKATSKKVQSTSDVSSSMQRKVIRVIASDFLCWMPICLISFLTLSGAIEASGDIYALTAIVILPINSVLNPFLYSDLFDKIWDKLINLWGKFRSPRNEESSQIENSQDENFSNLPMSDISS